MKEFWIYTGMRLGLFVGAFCMVFGVWFLLDDDGVDLILVLIVAFLISGVGSYFLLNRQRNALAQRVETRAGRMTAKFDEMKSREDED